MTDVLRLAAAIVMACALLASASVLLKPIEVDAKVTRRHRKSILKGLDCSACHTTDGWALSNRAGAKGGFDHARTGFPLTGEHSKTLCTECHQPKRRARRDCYTCHTDRHRGRLGRQCDSCHNSRSWAETRSIRRHRLTRLPLTGVHAVLDCTSCHLRRNEREFLPVPADCFACHQDDYRRSDVHPSHQGTPGDPSARALSRNCEQCHRPSGWTPAVVDPMSVQNALTRQRRDHDQFFVLSYGKHRGAECRSCHRSTRSSRLVSCNGCHAHSRTTIRRQHGRFISSQSAGRCLSCHPRGAAR